MHRCKEDDQPIPKLEANDVKCELRMETGGKLVYDLPYPAVAESSLHEVDFEIEIGIIFWSNLDLYRGQVIFSR